MVGSSLERGFRRLTLVVSLVLMALPVSWLGVEVVSALRLDQSPVRPGRTKQSPYLYTVVAVDPSGKETKWGVDADRPLSLGEIDSYLNSDPGWAGSHVKGVTRRVFDPSMSPTDIGRVWRALSSGSAGIALFLSIVGFGCPWSVFPAVRYVVRGFKEPAS